MLVYRVETEDGKGPYRGMTGHPDPEFHYRLARNHSDYAHPAAEVDGIDVWKLDLSYACGFGSLEALYTWFGDAMYKLESVGFRLNIFDAPDVEEGRNQLMFDRPKATKLKTYDFSEIFGVDHIRQIDYGWDGEDNFFDEYEEWRDALA